MIRCLGSGPGDLGIPGIMMSQGDVITTLLSAILQDTAPADTDLSPVILAESQPTSQEVMDSTNILMASITTPTLHQHTEPACTQAPTPPTTG